MEPQGSLPHSQEPRHLSLSWARSIQSSGIPSRVTKVLCQPTNITEQNWSIGPSFSTATCFGCPHQPQSGRIFEKHSNIKFHKTKSVQWEPSCRTRTEGQTDRHDEAKSPSSHFFFPERAYKIVNLLYTKHFYDERGAFLPVRYSICKSCCVLPAHESRRKLRFFTLSDATCLCAPEHT